MLPGPTIIRQCSSCSKYISERTIGSGNTYGARFWTDGKRDAPMLPNRSLLLKCNHCDNLVWINEQAELGETGPWEPEADVTLRFPDARPPSTPTLQEYADFLKAGMSNKKKEFYVRLRLWWAGNDDRRESEQPTPLDSFEIENLRAFLALLDEAEEDDRLMKAEALRELGEFAKAEELLDFKFDEEMTHAVDVIRELIKNRVATVAEIKGQ